MPRISRKRTSFTRRTAHLVPRERVLIVCEGEKTEPQYFADMARDLGLSGTDVRVCGKDCGSDPLSVVRYAVRAARDDGAFDHVFCVIDKDSHANLNAAVSEARQTRIKGVKTLGVILSVPCFEYWILIHYCYCAKPFVATGKRSVGASCLQELKKHWPDYEKAAEGVYAARKADMATAIANAKRRHAECQAAGTYNPSTLVYQVVERLQKIAADAGA
jgi:hypothetical protein